jgi:hypothetical protein
VVWAGLGVLEKAVTLVPVMAEVIAEDAEGIGGVAEAFGGLGSGPLFDKIGAERLILAMLGGFRGEEEAGLRGNSYRICDSDSREGIAKTP